MKIKLMKMGARKKAHIFGMEWVPFRYQAPLAEMVGRWSSLMPAFQPWSLQDLGAAVQAKATTIDDQVDGDLLKEIGEIAEQQYANQGRRLFAIDKADIDGICDELIVAY